MVAPNERFKPIIKPTLDGFLTVDEEMETVKMAPAEEMATTKEVQRVGDVDSEMETEKELPRSEAVAEGVLVEDDAYKAGEAASATDAHRIAAVKSSITQLDATHAAPTAPKPKSPEPQLADDQRRFDMLTRNIADTRAELAKISPDISTGNFFARAWKMLARKIDEGDRIKYETRLAGYEKQLTEVTARHPEFTKPKLTVVHEAANDVATPKSRWSTTEATKRMYTVEQKLVKTRFENLQRTIRAKQELVTRLEKTEPQSATMRYEQNALTRLAQELDTVYTSNKAFIDSLPDDEPVEAKKRA